jgi:hypothetical protein
MPVFYRIQDKKVKTGTGANTLLQEYNVKGGRNQSSRLNLDLRDIQNKRIDYRRKVSKAYYTPFSDVSCFLFPKLSKSGYG